MPDHTSHETFKMINRNFAKAIEKAKADHWKEWMEHISGDDLWNIHRYMKVDPTDYGCHHIPNLRNPNGTFTTTNADKASSLANMFFPPECPQDQNKHHFKEHNPPRANNSKFPTFSPQHIINTLAKLNPFKAPGPSGISNTILKHCNYIIVPLLSNIYSAIHDLNHYPSKFGKIHQIVLPKPGQVTYELLNSY